MEMNDVFEINNHNIAKPSICVHQIQSFNPNVIQHLLYHMETAQDMQLPMDLE